jgi:hypothetical protein
MFGFKAREFFDAEPEASQTPVVDLGFGGGTGTPPAPPAPSGSAGPSEPTAPTS